MPSGFLVVVFEYACLPLCEHCYDQKFGLVVLEDFVLVSHAAVEMIVLRSAVARWEPQERHRGLLSSPVVEARCQGDCYVETHLATGCESHPHCCQLRDT